MALYDGFFDAAVIEETYQYDREYDSADFTGYFGEFIGSGVCVHGNENSMLVSFRGGSVIVSPGYLFIQGYWLKNDADYAVPLSGAGVHAVVARLELGARMIEIAAEPKADPEVYPDALVLAYVTIDSAGTATVEDTRYNTDICGVIDSAGGLSDKVEYAIQYIDNEIEDRLSQIEEDLEAQAATLDAKIAEVDAMVEKLAPPPIGTIKFSASQDIEEGWLRCDGSFINEADYPELVAALGKVTPGVTEFTENAKGRIPMDISNGVLHNGRFWVFSYSTKTLYGISLSDDTVKEIAVSGADLFVSPRTYNIWLSIVDSEIFIAQQISSVIGPGILLYYNYSFTGTENELAVTRLEFVGASANSYLENTSVPMVLTVAKILGNDGLYKYYMACGIYVQGYALAYIAYYSWENANAGPIQMPFPGNLSYGVTFSQIPILDGASYAEWEDVTKYFSSPSYSKKNSGELISFSLKHVTNRGFAQQVLSDPTGAFSGEIVYLATTAISGNSDTKFSTISISDKTDFFASKYKVEDGTLIIHFCKTSTTIATEGALNTVSISTLNVGPRASTFADAAMYLTEQALWVFFVGTGIVFTRDLSDPSQYGFLDTQDTLGTITQFGYIEHDPATNKLYILGQDTTNTVKLGVLDIPPLYNYANDGAWLPMIASDGIPAYIKAKEPAEGA